jgi:hypothetical protein
MTLKALAKSAALKTSRAGIGVVTSEPMPRMLAPVAGEDDLANLRLSVGERQEDAELLVGDGRRPADVARRRVAVVRSVVFEPRTFPLLPLLGRHERGETLRRDVTHGKCLSWPSSRSSGRRS